MPDLRTPSPPHDAGSPALLISVDETARVLGVSRTLVNDLLARGELRSVKVGGRRMIPRYLILSMVTGQDVKPE